MEIFLLIGTFVLVLLLLGGITWLLYRKSHPKQEKGRRSDDGLRACVGLAKRFAASNKFYCIAPLNLTRSCGTANLDAVIIGYFGVLGVKALGYNGEIYGGTGEAEWLQVNAEEVRTYFPNPITEASGDVRVLRDALFAHKLKQIPVEVVCVFTSTKAQLALPRRTGHYTFKEFKTLLKKDKYSQDVGVDLEQVERALKESL